LKEALEQEALEKKRKEEEDKRKREEDVRRARADADYRQPESNAIVSRSTVTRDEMKSKYEVKGKETGTGGATKEDAGQKFFSRKDKDSIKAPVEEPAKKAETSYNILRSEKKREGEEAKIPERTGGVKPSFTREAREEKPAFTREEKPASGFTRDEKPASGFTRGSDVGRNEPKKEVERPSQPENKFESKFAKTSGEGPKRFTSAKVQEPSGVARNDKKTDEPKKTEEDGWNVVKKV